MTVEQSAGAAAKALEVLKDVPLWLLAGVAVAASVLLWMPGLVPLSIRPWFIGGSAVFGILAGARAIALLFERIPLWRKARDERRRFYMTPEVQQSFWATSKQADGSITTQVVARLTVKNRTEEPLGLSRVRLVSLAYAARFFTKMSPFGLWAGTYMATPPTRVILFRRRRFFRLVPRS